MNSRRRTNLIIIVMMIISLLGLMLVYPSLPDIIPTHWGPDGVVDGTGPKSMLFFLWAVIGFGNLLMLFAEKIDPRGENYAKFSKVFEIFRLVFTAVMTLMLAVNVYFVFNPRAFNMNKFMLPILGVMFMVLGNYMPKVKHNYTFGIKTPWTLASENVWNKTHRMSGPVWVVGGLLTAACGFMEGTAAAIAMTVVLAVMVIIPMAYSYLAFQKEKESMKNEENN